MKRLLAALLAAGVLVGGCGGDSRNVSGSAAAELQPRVAEIRQLAAQRQADRVAAKLAELRAQVADLVERRELSERAAQQILAAARRVEGQLALITTTTTPPRREDGDHQDGEEDD